MELIKIVEKGVEKLENIANVSWHKRNQDNLSRDKFIIAIEKAIKENITFWKAAGYKDATGSSRAMKTIAKNIQNKPGKIFWKTYILLLAGYKLCNTCNTVKLLDDFPLSTKESDGRYNQCKICNNKSNKKYYVNNTEDIYTQIYEKRKETVFHIIEVMKRIGKLPECSICGYKKNWAALEFHHIDSELKRPEWTYDKKGNKRIPANYIFGVDKKLAEKRYLSEVDNLEILCATCHREIHNEKWEM